MSDVVTRVWYFTRTAPVMLGGKSDMLGLVPVSNNRLKPHSPDNLAHLQLAIFYLRPRTFVPLLPSRVWTLTGTPLFADIYTLLVPGFTDGFAAIA
jgi:hypothetical protein